MRHRHMITVDLVRRAPGSGVRREVRDDLMPVQVEIDPMLGASPFGAAQQSSIEATCSGQIVDRKSKVEGSKAHGSIECGPPGFLSRLSSRLNCG